MQCHGVCKNTVSSRNFALSILQSEVWEDTVKDEKSRGFFKAFSFLYYFLLSLFSPSGNNTPDWLWHSTWDREATEMECFPKRMLRICQLWSTSGFLSWPSVSQSVSQFSRSSRVRLFATPWIAARQASLSITNSWSLLKLMSIESVMPSSHLILCHPLLLPPIPLSIRVFSSLQFTRKCFVSLLLTFSCFNSLLTKYQEPQQKNSSNCTYTAVRQKGVMPLKVNHYLRVGSNVHGSCH